jgi:hypothetical protein
VLKALRRVRQIYSRAQHFVDSSPPHHALLLRPVCLYTVVSQGPMTTLVIPLLLLPGGLLCCWHTL